MYLDWSSERATYEAKIASISSEVAAWKALVTSQTPTVSFARHQSQVLRLSTIFEKIVENLTQRVSALNESDPIKLKRSVNNAILQAGQFWSYFESKLLTRYAAHTANFLLAADEFAWACLTDLNDARLGDANFVRKSPPLIYLGPNFSPFVIPADWSIKNQIAGVNDQLFEQFTRSIPFSVLGLPFYQTAHLPEIMVLAHEIGHVIDFDLGLTKTLDVCLDSLPASVLSTEHKEFWAKCRIESFADIVGALIGGPAFVQSLAHFLMATVENVATEAFSDRREYSYPTCYIRILLCLETLKVNGKLPPRAAQTLQAWQNRFGTQHAASDYEKDLPAIVQCLVDTSLPELGDKSIRSRIGLNSDSYARAEKLAEEMLQGKKPSSTDARTILSAATLAYFQNPEQYVARGVAGISLASVTSNAKNKARFGEKSLVETDQRTGSGLAGLLG